MAPTDKDVYIKRFSALKKGAPLYQPSEVQVGDVGYIDSRDGFFQKLYNIADPPTNGKPDCPRPIELKTSRRTEEWDAIHLKKSKGFGASSQANIKSSEMQFEFSKVKRGECILIPGNIVVMEYLEGTGNLPKYMHKHLNWIGSTFAGEKGYPFTPQCLLLVERTVKTDRWAIAVNMSLEVVKNLSFKIASAAGATLWGQWSSNSVISRRGPLKGKLLVAYEIPSASHPTGIEGANQTIFVRGIRLRPPISYFGKPSFGSTRKPSALERFRATMAGFKQDYQWWVPVGDAKAASIKQDWWGGVEEPEDIQTLPAAASWVEEPEDAQSPPAAASEVKEPVDAQSPPAAASEVEELVDAQSPPAAALVASGSAEIEGSDSYQTEEMHKGRRRKLGNEQSQGATADPPRKRRKTR